MTSISKSTFCGAYIAILGFVFFLLPVNQAAAAVTYYGAYTQATTSRSIYTSVTYPYTLHQLHFNFNSFDVFNDINGVNFIDLKLTASSTYQTRHLEVVVCTQLVQDYDDWTYVYPHCNTNTVIATSTSVLISDFVSSSGEFKWVRFYFDDVLTGTFSPGEHLYFSLQPLSSEGGISPSDIKVSTQVGGYNSYQGMESLFTYWGQSHFRGTSYSQLYPTNYRLGYDDGVGQLQLLYNNYYDLGDLTFRFNTYFDVPKNITDLYDDFITEWSFTVQEGTSTVQYYSAFDILEDLAPGAASFNAEFSCDTDCYVVTSAITLSGIVGASTTPLMTLNNYSFGLGTSTTYTQLENFVQEYSPLYVTEELTNFGTSSCSWLSGNFNMFLCFGTFIVPSSDQILKLVGYATSSVFDSPPFGYVNRVVNIFLDDSTTTLPSVVLTVPEGLPGAGKSLNLSPWEVMRSFWYYTPSGNFVSTTSTMTIWDLVSPFWYLLMLAIFGLWFVILIIRFKP